MLLQGLVVVQTIWDEKMPMCVQNLCSRPAGDIWLTHTYLTHLLTHDGTSYEKINAELPLLDSRIKDFEKRHEDVRTTLIGNCLRLSASCIFTGEGQN